MPAKCANARVFAVASTLVMALGCHHATLGSSGADAHVLSEPSSEDLFQAGLRHARRGDSLRAEQYLSAARSRGYDEASAVYWLVRVCLSGGRYHSALSHAIAHLRDQPRHWALRLVVASIYEALGDLRRAQLELEHIVEAEPSRPLARYRLAMLYRRVEAPSLSSALPHLKAYLALAPDGPHAEEVRSLLVDARDTRIEAVGGTGEP